jgi:mRNA interferase RelE/StbE
MDKYAVELKSGAAKELRKIPHRDYIRISDKIRLLSDIPRPHGVKKLQSAEEKYRIRVGDYRILYFIDDIAKIVTIYAAGHRKDIYRF